MSARSISRSASSISLSIPERFVDRFFQFVVLLLEPVTVFWCAVTAFDACSYAVFAPSARRRVWSSVSRMACAARFSASLCWLGSDRGVLLRLRHLTEGDRPVLDRVGRIPKLPCQVAGRELVPAGRLCSLPGRECPAVDDDVLRLERLDVGEDLAAPAL